MTRVGGRHLTKFALGLATVTLLMGCEGGGTLIEGRYLIQGDNGDVVLDTVTGLEWQRCSEGQIWNGSICIREAAMAHPGAIERNVRTREETEAKLESLRRPGHPPRDQNPWRLPTKDELRTLVFCSNGNPARFKDSDERCYGDHQVPTIVLRAFPNTPSTTFWSSTLSHPERRGLWSVNFSNGQATPHTHARRGAVRLVRAGQQR